MAETSSSIKAFMSNPISEKYGIVSKLSDLTKKIEMMKLNIYDVTRNKYIEFLPQLVTAGKLSNLVQALKEEMTAVKTEIDTEISSQPNTSSSQFQSLSSQLEETTLTLSGLEKILALNQHLESADEAFRHTEFVKVTSDLLATQEILSRPVHVREDEIKILKAIETEMKIQKEKLVHELNETWRHYVVWDVQNAKSSEQNIINKLKIINPEKNNEILRETVQAMWKLDILDTWLLKFSDSLLRFFIKPIITQSANILKQSNEDTSLGVVIDPTVGDRANPESALFQILVILSHLNESLLCISLSTSSNEEHPTVPLMEHFGDLNSEVILQVVVQECLMHSIPSNNKDLEKFNDVIAVVNSFQDKLSAMSFIKEDIVLLKDFIENVNVIFANKKCQEILEAARKLMTSEIHQTVIISNDKPLGDLPPLDSEARKLEMLANGTQLIDNTFRLPTCHISESVVKLVFLAYETLNEAVVSSGPCALLMFYAVRNMFELFCTIFPTYHKRSLATLSQLTAIHHNNCMYISHHLVLMGPQFSRMSPSPLQHGETTFMDLIQTVRSIGTRALMQQMATQRDDLLDCLSSAAGFVSISEEGNHFTAERSIKQVVYKLNLLKTVWEDILLPHIYSKAMGTLVNCTLVEVVDSITSLKDISAEDASHLHHLLCVFDGKAGPLFCTKHTVDTSNEAHKVELRNIPKWMKFKELIFVLNANLQEICDRWADGKGVLAHEFIPNEMGRLIRALFQKTDRRAAVLSKIR